MSDSFGKKIDVAASFDPVTLLKGIAGGIIGGVIGYFVFVYLHKVGLYAFVLPGVLAGFGCSLLAKSRSKVFAVIGGLSALVAGVLSEYHTNWFVDDNNNDLGFVHFLTHIHQSRSGMALIAILLSVAVGAWLGRRA